MTEMEAKLLGLGWGLTLTLTQTQTQTQMEIVSIERDAKHRGLNEVK